MFCTFPATNAAKEYTMNKLCKVELIHFTQLKEEEILPTTPRFGQRPKKSPSFLNEKNMQNMKQRRESIHI